MLTIELAARITAILVAIGVLQSSLQLLAGWKEYCAVGLFEWNSSRIRNGSSRQRIGWLVGSSGTLLLRFALVVRTACALGLMVPFQGDVPYAIFALGIVLSSLFLAYQIGYGKDGSNQITVIVAAGLLLIFLLPVSSAFRPVGLYFIAAQALFSYFAAGLSKIRNASWREGSALQTILNTATYGQSRIANLLTRRPWAGKIVGWSVISVEIVFPVALISPVGVLAALLIAGGLLHLGTVAMIGLDTFFWAFTATFPAIIFAHGVFFGS